MLARTRDQNRNSSYKKQAVSINGRSALSPLVALYGGAFNPPTKAHLRIARAVRDRLKAEEVWMLVTLQNRFKPRSFMADYTHRLSMTELLVKDEPRIRAVDMERRYETNHSAHTLKRLVTEFPRLRFVWVMGADNFINFHQWHEWRYIIQNFPVILVPRLGFTEVALCSPAAATLKSRTLTELSDPRVNHGWHRLTIPEEATSATQERHALASGGRNYQLTDAVKTYITQNKLYI